MVKDILREETGIVGLDKMLQGGFPSGSIIAISGPPGVGKSIFSLHFLVAGARKGQKCVYINIEEPRSNIDNMISQFNFADEFYKLEDKGFIIIKCFDYAEYEKFYKNLFEKIAGDKKINRLVVDSFNCFFASVPSYHRNINHDVNVRKMINHIFSLIRRKNLTTLVTLEAHQDKDSFYYNIPFLVDGIINLDFISLGSLERRIFIPKMRWTKQYDSTRPFEITKRGVVIKKEA